ncbi:MAG: YebC/PmpR family DNA-binding transcriptional regulator [Chthoniobacterales bacterium]
MAGHSKWSKVKHIKAVVDVRRARVFSRLSKEIAVAARLGGENPDFNPRLRAAVQSARDKSMPNDNIERAIKKGTGELSATAVEEVLYEGYGSGGVAVLVEAATDNRNRTAADLRHIFGRHGGNLATSGSVAFQFHRCGEIMIPVEAINEEDLLELLIEAGGEDFQRHHEDDTEFYLVKTPPESLYAIGEALRKADLPIENQRLSFIAETPISPADEAVIRNNSDLIDALEDNGDVLTTHSNLAD